MHAAAEVSADVAIDTPAVNCMHIHSSKQNAHLFELLRLHSSNRAPVVALCVEAGNKALGLRPKYLIQADAAPLTSQHLSWA